MKILVSLTTTREAHWRDKIKEAKKLGLTEVSLFVSAIGPGERQELYAKLKETKIKSIPFVHLRSDMKSAEVEFLIKNYGSKVFNIHSQREFPLQGDLSKFRRKIYMENTSYPIMEEVGQWAGICLDVSHHEDKKLTGQIALRQDVEKVLKKYKIGVWHLNSIRKEALTNHPEQIPGYDYHSFNDLKEFDYCKKYKKYLPKHYIGLELENTLADQLRAKDYVTKLLKS